MNKWLELLLGLILIIIPLYAVLAMPVFASWGIAALSLIKGGIIIFLIFVGVIFLILGLSDLKD